MNSNELKAEIVRKGYSIPRFSEAIGMDKKTLYAKINGESSFKQSEIQAIAGVLKLSGKRILDIFFTS